MAEHRSFRLTVTAEANSTTPGSRTASAKYSEAVVVAVAQQVVSFVLASLLLDGGVGLRFWTIAAIASWMTTLLILLRRPKQPTDLDLAIVKYGFWFAMFVVTLVGSIRIAILL